jgi:heme/copper-type cytochrome/quinol oxidase subunit 3
VTVASLAVERTLVRGHEPGSWGMAMLILTEATLFVYLLASYVYLRHANARWPAAGLECPDLLVASINTVILLASSLPMWWPTPASATAGRFV